MQRDAGVRVGLALSCGLVAAAAALVSGTLWRAELATADLRARVLPAQLPSRARVVVVAIDDESLQAAARDPAIAAFPWPRWVWARMLAVLALAKPAAVGFDLLLPEPRAGDEEFAQALRQNSAVLSCDVGEGRMTGGLGVPGEPPVLAPTRGITSPPTAVLAAAAPYATIHVEADEDGVTRTFPLVSNVEGKATAALPLALAMRAGASAHGKAGGLWVNGTRVTGRDGRLWLRFGGGLGAFRYLPAWRVLQAWQAIVEGDEAETVVAGLRLPRDAVLIIGLTATGGQDLRPTPMAAISPGSEVLATAVADLLDGRHTSPPSAWVQAACALVVAGLIGLLAAVVRRPTWLAVASLAIVGVWWVAAFATWRYADGWLPLAAPSGAAVLAIPLLLFEGWLREGAERRRVQGIFGLYVAPDVLRTLLAHPDAIRLGGERRQLTVLFSDIRSYTTLSEGLPPEEIVGWLNEYFTAQVDVIRAHRGTVDKFIGDAVMAFWGAPLAQPEQERMAASCAGEMIRTARRLAASWRERGGPPLAIGVGLATGAAVVGNVGAEQLRGYTAIGDTVNLASRLEGKTKELGVPVVLDEATALASGLAVRAVGEITVKGRSAAVRVYALADLNGQAPAPE
jgi:adenylate cyclase